MDAGGLLLGLHGSDGHHVDDILHRATAAQIVHRHGDALDHRADGLCTRQPLHQLVPDVPGGQVGEDRRQSGPARRR